MPPGQQREIEAQATEQIWNRAGDMASARFVQTRSSMAEPTYACAGNAVPPIWAGQGCGCWPISPATLAGARRFRQMLGQARPVDGLIMLAGAQLRWGWLEKSMRRPGSQPESFVMMWTASITPILRTPDQRRVGCRVMNAALPFLTVVMGFNWPGFGR